MSTSETDNVVHKLKCITIISLIFMSIQIVGGLMANSIAILADAFHLLSDVLAYVISLYAVLLSLKKPPKYLSFGYQKIQPLFALINVGIIWIVTLQLFIQATQRIFKKQIVEEPFYMLLTSIFGLCCNLYIMKILHSTPGGHGCSHNHSHTHSHSHSHAHSHQNSHSHSNTNKNSHDHSKCNGHHHHDQSSQNITQNGEQQTKKLSPSKPKQQIPRFNGINSMQLINKNPQSLKCIEIQPEVINQICQEEHNNLLSDEDNDHHHFDNMNLEAAYIHILSDIILSIGVIVSASLVYCFASTTQWTYWQLSDPLCTYFFSIMAIYTTIPIAKESIVIILDGIDNRKLKQKVQNQLKSKGQINEFRMWTLNRGKYCATLKIALFQNVELSQIKNIFSHKQIDATIQIDLQ